MLECSLCGKTYGRKVYLIRHLEKHEASKSVCKFCNKKYASKAHLKKHELAHTESSFRCHHCRKSFASEDERKQHVKMEHQRNCVCSACKSRFRTEESLAKHRNLFCSNNETDRFVCENCGKQFKLKGNLKVHAESKCGTERTYPCDTCGKSFMTRPSLATHRLLHTGEKNFVCRYCGKGHRTKGEVQRHELIHTRDKPFVCKVCLKAFAHRESLITHSTLHTGIKPYICDGCGKGFSCVGNLIKHRKNNARCATSDSQRNRPRIKKPTFHSLLIDPHDREVSLNENVPFTAVAPCGDVSVECIVNDLSTVQYNIDDTLLPLTKPVTDLDVSENPPHQLQGALRDRRVQEKELDEDRKCLTENSMISCSANIDSRNCSRLWAINSESVHTDSSQSKIGGDYNTYEPVTKPPLNPPLVQTSANRENATRKQNLHRGTLEPFINVEASQSIKSESENVARPTLQSRSSFVDGEDKTRPSTKSEEDSREETPVECDFEANDLDGGNSTDCGSVSAAIGDRKPEPSLYEDHYLSWVKSGNPATPEEVATTKSKEVVPVDSTALTLKHTKDGLFSCPSCRKCFREEERLRWHAKTHDSRFVDAKKNEVGYISDDDEPLGIRLRRHVVMLRANQEFPCQYCSENFENDADYKRHKRMHHANNAEKLTFPCPHCPKVYKFRRALLRHEPRHTGGTFRCKKCDETFKVFKEYQLHVRTSHWKRFPCDTCGHSFPSSSELDSHVRCNHVDALGGGVSCEACGKRFKHEVNLRRHVESRCGASPRFVCKTCGKSYLSQGGYESHQLVHAGTRAYLCRYCGKDFRHKSVLLIHELTHTGEKPFVCRVCSKAFAHQISLTTHASVHTGIKPYVCEGCGAGFSCFGNLKKHRLAHMSTCSLTRIRKSK